MDDKAIKLLSELQEFNFDKGSFQVTFQPFSFGYSVFDNLNMASRSQQIDFLKKVLILFDFFPLNQEIKSPLFFNGTGILEHKPYFSLTLYRNQIRAWSGPQGRMDNDHVNSNQHTLFEIKPSPLLLTSSPRIQPIFSEENEFVQLFLEHGYREIFHGQVIFFRKP